MTPPPGWDEHGDPLAVPRGCLNAAIIVAPIWAAASVWLIRQLTR